MSLADHLGGLTPNQRQFLMRLAIERPDIFGRFEKILDEKKFAIDAVDFKKANEVLELEKKLIDDLLVENVKHIAGI